MQKDELNAYLIAIQQGDNSILREVYNIMSHSVFAMALSVTKNYAIAQEIMQDTFIKLQQKINYYTPNTNAKAFIITIARNLSINEINKNKRSISSDILDDVLNDNSNIELSAIIKITLLKLNDLERQIVVLNAVGRFKFKEIAFILNKPLGTVLWIYSKAIKKLKNEMKEA